jgi:hypothetical protein
MQEIILLHDSKVMQFYTLPTEGNLFEALLTSVRFEMLGKGRQGTVLVKCDETEAVPIVRTTTKYTAPAQRFQSVHEHLAQQIQKIASLSVGFNNALIENYTNAYTKMGSHSDQALDLTEESFIAIFSCYKYPELANPPRQLIAESKESGSDPIEIPLTPNSVVLFDLKTNRQLKHKIGLDKSAQPPENQWLGITFRTSKTFVQFREGSAYFPDDTQLTLANDEQTREFYHLRGRENNEMDFTYPRITYTLSESDIMSPGSTEIY